MTQPASAYDRGLPGPLPAGETVVWQGAPDLQSLACRAFHLPAMAIYFAVLVGWAAIETALHGAAPREILLTTAKCFGLACAALGLIVLYAWLVARGTVYTITSRRLVMRVGVALPVTISIPFREVASAGLRPFREGPGDLPLEIAVGNRMSYLLLWPHVRPWRISKPQPMFLSVPDAPAVASLLARTVAAVAPQSVQIVVGTPSGGVVETKASASHMAAAA